MSVRQAVERLPLLGDVDRRRRLILAARAVRRLRRHAFERAGSPRFSRPEIPGLLQYLNFDGGFFVEAGANDGYRQSNTYYLERFRGWTGVLVEPIPELWERCKRERPRSRCINCALVDDAAATPRVTLRYDDLGSHVLGSREAAAKPGCTCWGWDNGYDVDVDTRRLGDVLDEMSAPRVDFLSLDVEGYEEVVLAGLELEVRQPTYILVEAFDQAARRPSLERMFAGRYELLAQPTNKDLLFRSVLSPASERRPRGS